MNNIRFPKGFTFGAATAAFQIEGAPKADGKGPSIWDEFTQKKGKIRNGETANVACDHYRRYKSDISLMKDLSLDAYRFSVSWPRVFPSGEGKLNQKGLDFYRKLVDNLLENEISPYITLFHWDLPLALQKKYGGFQNRIVSEIFGDYVETLVQALGDRVDNWITINEPFEYACFGHLIGYHAPGTRNPWAYFKVMHNLLRGHGIARDRIKRLFPESNVGIALSMTPVHPVSNSERDRWSALIANQFMNHIALAPLFKGAYPKLLADRMKFFMAPIKDGDMELIGRPIDFLGLNIYSRTFATYKWYIPFLKSLIAMDEVPDTEYKKNGKEYSSIGWEVYPDCMFECLKIVQEEYGNPPVYITENGAPYTDIVEDGKVPDTKRTDYLKAYISKMFDASQEGADIRGYFVWSLLDNFEWSEGLTKRFGLIHVDYKTQRRIIKSSGYWYRNLIRTQKELHRKEAS